MIKYRLLRGTSFAAAALSLLVSGAVAAQTQPDPDVAQGASPAAEGAAVPTTAAEPAFEGDEEIVVTGTLIRGSPEDSALPIDVISAEELSKQGSPSALDLIKNLSVSSGVIGDANQFDSRAQGSEGIASVNLRGLGPSRTLVLLNGRRIVNVGNAIPLVDANLLPSSAIGRVEVLKDGAAATYGSDAIAGVVNFITKSNQEGFLASGDYRYIDGSDGGDYTAGLSYGHQQEGFRVLLSGSYQHRSELRVTDRDFAVRPFTENPQGGWTGGGNPGNFDFNILNGVGQFVADEGCTSVGGFRTPVTNRCRTQYTPFGNIVEREDRYQAYAEIGIDLTDRIEIEFTGLYGHTLVPEYATSPSYLLTQAPSLAARARPGATIPGIFPTALPAGVFTVPGTNPGLIAYRAAYPNAAVSGPPGTPAVTSGLLFRPVLAGGNPSFTRDGGEFGPATSERSSDSMRFTAVLRGDITDTLRFEAGYTYSRYERQTEGYDTFGDRFQLALSGLGGFNCNTPTPGLNGCQYFNPFSTAVQSNPTTGDVNPAFNAGVANPASLIDWFFVRSYTQLDTSLHVADALISGDTGFELGGGAIGFAIGAQYRKNDFEAFYADNSNIAINPCPGTPVNGDRSCSPQTGALGFLGTSANRQADGDVWAVFGEVQVPFTDTINLQLSARYENYGGAVGSTFDPQARVRWQIFPWLALRGGVGTTFRGPPDPALIPSSVTALQLIGTSFRAVDIFGNPALTPESATTYSGGVILDAGGFSGSVDYFRYDFKDGIVGEPTSNIVASLFGTSGTANCGNPAFAALQARFTFTGACSIANVSRLRTNFVNGPEVTTSGIDAMGQYRLEFGDDGSVAIGGTATYVIEYVTEAQTVEGIVVAPEFDAVGQLNYQTTAYPLPQWKGQGYLEAGLGMHNARLTVNYIDGYRDQRTSLFTAPDPDLGVVIPRGENIGEYVTADFTYRITLPTDTIIALTVNNIFDKDPPFVRLDQNYDPFTHSPLGRNFKIGVSQKF